MIELQSIYRYSFNCIHLDAILDPLIEIYLLNPILISSRMVNELFLLLHRNFGITYRRILNLQTQLMILNANLKQFFLCELMNRDVFIFIYCVHLSILELVSGFS